MIEVLFYVTMELVRRVKNLFPKMYKKDIYHIPYGELKKKNIKCLVFDFDNTLVPSFQKNWDQKLEKLMEKLDKQKFIIIILSNNTKKRFLQFQKKFNIRIITLAVKPLPFRFKKICKEYHLKASEIAMIGDQMFTDVLGANRVGMYTILVDPLEKKDLRITSLNRKLEQWIKKKYHWKDGEYFEKM